MAKHNKFGKYRKRRLDIHSPGILRSLDCYSVPTFRDNLLVPSSRVKRSMKKLGCLTVEDGINRLSRNVGTE
jgi:hypothetical protein